MKNSPRRCTECSALVTRSEHRRGWPVTTAAGTKCPSCYGDEAFCRDCGQSMYGDRETTRCIRCDRKHNRGEPALSDAQDRIRFGAQRSGGFWPVGAGEHAAGRALARRGLVRETTGECEGCGSHRPGHKVAVFVPV